MARIRVNTEDLKNKAKDFDSAADAFKRAGDEILTAAMSMPSYDGQLSGPARKMGYEFQKQARELSTVLAGDAESLRKTAQAFEDVDNQTIESLNNNLVSIKMSTPQYSPLGPSWETAGIDENFGYAYSIENDIYIIWFNGQMIRFDHPTGDTLTFLLEFKHLVDDYYDALNSFPIDGGLALLGFAICALDYLAAWATFVSGADSTIVPIVLEVIAAFAGVAIAILGFVSLGGDIITMLTKPNYIQDQFDRIIAPDNAGYTVIDELPNDDGTPK
jgi:hypothetical protein